MAKSLPRKIAVVASDPQQRSWLGDVLTNSGHSVLLFEDPETVLAALDRFAPALIVAGLSTPQLEGWTICRGLHPSQSTEKAASPPVLVLSAHITGEAARQITTDLGGSGLLPYPVSEELLLSEVTTLLEHFVDNVRRDAKESRFQQAVQKAGAGYFSIDADGCYRWVNDAWLRLHGYSRRDEIAGRHFSIVQTADDLEKAGQIFRTLLAGSEVPAMEFRRKRKDGSVGRHAVWARPVADGGRTVGIEGFLVDTTAPGLADECHQMIFDRMLDGFALHEMIFDADGRPADYRFLAVNPAFEQATGLKATEIIGKTVLSVLPTLERHWIENYGRVVTTGEAFRFDSRQESMGKEFDVLAYRPSPGQFACIFRDVTRQKENERELRRLFSLNQLRSQVNRAIVRAATLEELLESVCKSATLFGHFSLTWIGILDEVTGDLQVSAQDCDEHGFPYPIRASECEVNRQAIEQARPQICNWMSPEQSGTDCHLRAIAAGIGSCAAFPIHIQGRVRGSLCVHAVEDEFFHEAEVALLEDIALDISFALDKLEAEKVRRESEERFATAFEHFPAAATISRVDDGTILQVNRKFETVFGFTREQAIGQTAWSLGFLTLEQRKELVGLLDVPRRLQPVELPMRTQSGRILDCVPTIELIHVKGHDCVLSLIVDVTERNRAEQALRETKANLTALIESTDDLIWSVDLNFGLLSFNGALAKNIQSTFGLVATVGMKPGDLNLPARANERTLLYRRALEEGPFRTDYRLLDGRLLELSFNPIIHDGRAAGVSVFGKDITEHNLLEDTLRRSEAKFAAFFESSPTALSLLDAANGGSIFEVNAAWEKLYGWPREEAIGRTLMQLGIIDTSVAERGREMVSREGRIRDLEYEFRRKNGETGIGMASATILDVGGKHCALGSIIDITQRRRAEEQERVKTEELRVSEAKYRQLYESMLDGFVRVDMNGRLVEFNEAYRLMLGYESAELRELTYIDLTPEKWRGFEADLIASQVLQEGCSGIYEKEYRRKNGTIFPIEVRATLVTDQSGRPEGIWAIVRDITGRKQSEDLLRESEYKFRATFMNGPDPLFITALQDGRIVDVNGSFEKLFGHSREEIIGKTTQQLNLYGDSHVRPMLLAELERNGQLTDFEIKARKKDGEMLDAALSMAVMRFSGEPQITGALRDITADKRAAAALQRNQERLRALVRISQYRAPTIKDFLDYALGESVAFTESRYGYIYTYSEERQEFTLNTWSKDVMPECAVVDPQSCYELAGTGAWGEAVRQRKAIVINDFHAANIWKKGYPEGHVAITRFMTVPVFKADQIVAVVGVANKVEEYSEADVLQLTLLMDGVWKSVEVRQAEQLLREANEHSFAVAKCLPDVIWSMDLSGRFTYVSPSVERIYGWTVDEALLLTRWDTSSARQSARSALLFKKELERTASPQYDRNRVITFESEDLRKDGSTFSAEINASFIWSEDGSPIAVTGVTRDITDRKRSEAEREKLRAEFAQAQKMESVGRLAGGVAHDFNNLLTVINGYSLMLKRNLDESDPLFEPLSEIYNAGERAAQLTRQLLALGRKHSVELLPTNLNGLIEGSREMFRRLLGEDIEFAVELAPALGQVMADSGSLHQVLMNLIVNARDAMPQGGKLTIETANVELDEDESASLPGIEPGRFIRIKISDTGTGMNEDVRSHIFEPFYTTKGEGVGTGLGLSTVYGIVNQIGGAISVQSELTHGSTFVIHLPRTQDHSTAGSRAAAPQVSSRGTETVLVVEDQAEVRKIAAMVLKGYGYCILEAANGPEALLVAEGHPGKIHLLLTDVVMPGMSGPELAGRIELLRPKAKVLFMSGYAADVMTSRGLLEPGVPYVAKPFAADTLAAKVRESLGPPEVVATVLVVDDEPGVRAFFGQVLSGAGYRVRLAKDGKEALQIARTETVQVVLTDLVMPEQEGLETIQALRRDAPGVKIIAVSGAFAGMFLKAAKMLGANATLSKPASPEVLLATVSQVLMQQN